MATQRLSKGGAKRYCDPARVEDAGAWVEPVERGSRKGLAGLEKGWERVGAEPWEGHKNKGETGFGITETQEGP